MKRLKSLRLSKDTLDYRREVDRIWGLGRLQI